jgi:hypothetical protein
MKKPWLAFLLNFLISGLGFAYLGKWAWAVINLVAALAVGIGIYYVVPNSVNMASVVVGVINGSIAMSVANAMNAKRALQAPPPPQPTPTGQ